MDLADDWASQPQLPAGTGNQPGPAVGCIGVARADGRPTERLFEEAEGMLHREATQIPAPQAGQVSRQRTADPGQPQWAGWQFLLGQALDLDADHAERRIWRAAHVQVGPDVDRDGAIQRVLKLARTLRLTMRLLVDQSKRLAVQARSAAARTPFGVR